MMVQSTQFAQSAQGGFIAGTLVHTREGLKPIEQIKVGDWVLSRPDNPEQGTETGYKRVTKTLSFEDKEVIKFWFAPNRDVECQTERVYATPNHPVWLNPHGWVAMGRLYDPDKKRLGSFDWDMDGKELVLADGGTGAMLDVDDLYRTDNPAIAFAEEDDWGFGCLVDFSGETPVFGDDLPYDYDKWGDPVDETRVRYIMVVMKDGTLEMHADPVRTRERYTTTVYNLEVEDWHTYFVGKMGLWVHNTNCLEATLEVALGRGDVKQLLTGALKTMKSDHGFEP